MSGSRMGFDLRTKMGRRNFWFVWKRRKGAYKVQWKLTLQDTFMPLVCAVWCHEPYDAAYGHSSTPEWACKRCGHYIPDPVAAEERKS